MACSSHLQFSEQHCLSAGQAVSTGQAREASGGDGVDLSQGEKEAAGRRMAAPADEIF
jgi:hypothetical protein